jgi:hypothetical protein
MSLPCMSALALNTPAGTPARSLLHDVNERSLSVGVITSVAQMLDLSSPFGGETAVWNCRQIDHGHLGVQVERD